MHHSPPTGWICSVSVVCVDAALVCHLYQQPSMIVSPNSFVQRSETVSVSEIQVGSSLDQHLDPLHQQAGLHSHSERSLWPKG